MSRAGLLDTSNLNAEKLNKYFFRKHPLCKIKNLIGFQRMLENSVTSNLNAEFLKKYFYRKHSLCKSKNLNEFHRILVSNVG